MRRAMLRNRNIARGLPKSAKRYLFRKLRPLRFSNLSVFTIQTRHAAYAANCQLASQVTTIRTDRNNTSYVGKTLRANVT
jgi:hypothetical protein